MKRVPSLTRQQWRLFDYLAAGGEVEVDSAGKAEFPQQPGRRRPDVTNKYRALRRAGLVVEVGGMARLTGAGLSTAAERRLAGLLDSGKERVR